VVVIDEDLGVSGSGTVERGGFARLTAEVALGASPRSVEASPMRSGDARDTTEVRP
jgi:hypothetical protein